MVDLSSESGNLKCAESYCLPLGYDKLEVPFNDVGAVNVSVDLDVLQVSISPKCSKTGVHNSNLK